jgi:hypothetical protein
MPTTYYSCTTIGCSATTQVTSFSTLQACQTGCISWGCNLNVLQEDTNIYVFYDTSSMAPSWLENAYNAVNEWVAAGIPGFSGNLYHTLDHREKWLQYDNIIYSGNVAGITPLWDGGLPASDYVLTGNNSKAQYWKDEQIALGITNWYDMYQFGASFTDIFGNVATSQGLPPQSLHSDNVLVITFNDEAAPLASGYHAPQSSGVGFNGQPTTQWIADYDSYTAKTWNQVQSAGGKLDQFIYIAASGVTNGMPNLNCSVTSPCTSGPLYYQYYNYAQPGTGGLVASSTPLEASAITSTFTNAAGGQVIGCTGPYIVTPTPTNPNPCPDYWSFGVYPSGPPGNLGPPYYGGMIASFTYEHQNHALQVVASIDSGNKTNINGTWQVATAPMKDTNANWGSIPNQLLSTQVNMGFGVIAQDLNNPNLEMENPYWVDANGVDINLFTTPNPVGPKTNHGGLDQYGWGYNIESVLFSGPRLTTAINSFLAQGFTAQTLCTSADTSNTPTYPYDSEVECQTLDGCGNYACSTDGCITWGSGPFTSLNACTAACQSYECRASGCTSVVGSGGTYYVSGVTAQNSLTACTASCISYNCSPTGCTELTGSGGTFQTNQSCTASCISYACVDSGCTSFPGSGNTPYSAQTACTTNCVSWNCTPTGCVERAGTGGTYVLLAHCTTACTSYYCTHSGCTEQTGTGGTFSTSAACTASCTSYLCSDTGCTQQSGSGGTYYNSAATQDSYTACTAHCVSYSCTTTGCSIQVGSGGTYWSSVSPATALANCNVNCTSYNCSPTGCILQSGTGGHYATYNACSAACYSYQCSATGCQISGGTGSTYLTIGACQTSCKSWDCLSNGCTEQAGTGGTHTIYTNCTSGCSSYECRATGCTEVAGTGGTDYSACTGVCSSYTCSDSGCLVQQGSGGTYYNSGNTAQDALTACTASCRSWNCTDTGCVVRSGTSGTFSSLADCLTGDSVTHISGCSSFECRASGCTQIVGTGGTSNIVNCTPICISWNCSPTGCTELVGSGGTYQVYSDCTSNCLSYNCTDSGCTPQVGTGGTFSTDVACATACTSYYCTITGCTLQYGTGGTFTDLNDCSSACTSFECRDSGCTEVVGTGSTNALSACTAQCQSYNCSDTGCITVTGSGGTFYNANSLQDSLTACTASCASFFCTPTGCTEQTGTGGTYSALTSCTASCSSWNCSPTGCTQLNGTGGTFTREIDCTTGCTSYNCTDSGCVERIGTGGTYTTSAACTASCVSYGCSDDGCSQQVGSGATHFNSGNTQDALTACTASCRSWNCTDSGCTEITGTGGTYSALTYCQTGTTWGQLPCTSWFCTVTGCTEQQGSGGTYANSGLCAADAACVSYYCVDTGCTQVVGSGGTVNSSGTCTASCTSWSCTPSGCTEQQGTGGTYSTQAHCTTACTSFFCTDSGCTEQIGTGGTYSTSASCTASCSSFYCTPVGCTEQTGTGGTFSTTGTCTAQCQSYNCSDNGCVIQNGTGGTYYRSSSLQDSLTACTASCYSYQCSDSGCNKVTGSGGTHYNISYPWHAQTACTASCVSWACGPSGVVTGPNNSACIEQVGTGSTWTIEQDCVTNCQSWNCGDTGCEFAAGSGGTWYNLNNPSLSQTNCSIHCWSYWCDTMGCQDETGSGSTFYVLNSGDLTFDNVYRAETACTEDCQQWSCTTQSGLFGPTGQPTGCLEIPGTGATNTNEDFIDCYTACTSYDCGAQGCYLAVGGSGQYYDIQVCENACMSWQCTDTGCELLEGNTGTTSQPPCEVNCVSYDCTDNGCVQRPGLGGQHLTLSSCELTCNSWFCDNISCTEQDGTGSTFTSLNACTVDCQSWNCEDFGCSQQVGTGATHETQAICSTACTSFECNGGMPWMPNYGCGGALGCCELSGTGWTHTSLLDCTGSCSSYSCEEYPTGCTSNPGLTGFQTDPAVCSAQCMVFFCSGVGDAPATDAYWPTPNEVGCYGLPGNPFPSSGNYSNFHFNTLIQCQDFCMSYDCGDTGCTTFTETGHTFTSDAVCQTMCRSWQCTGATAANPGASYGCQELNGTGGTYSSITQCDCFTYDCTPSGCIPIAGAGGYYQELTACTTDCQSYNCTDSGCILLTNNSGVYQSLGNCQSVCTSYKCEYNGCEVLPGTGATFENLANCLTGCTSWQCLDNGCTSFAGTGSTYATENSCTGVCQSWSCEDWGVFRYDGTGHTFSSYPQATGMCQSLDCQATYNGDDFDGCTPFNPAPTWFTPNNYYWGTGGTHASMSACSADCVGWGCNNIAITQFAKLYVYYDITSMGTLTLEEAYNRVVDWVSSIPGWSGSTYHVLSQSEERWLSWPVISYSGRSLAYNTKITNVGADPMQSTMAEFPFTNTLCSWQMQPNEKVSKILYWASQTQAGLDGKFWDMGVTGACSPQQTFTYGPGDVSSSSNLYGITMTNHTQCYQGLPPVASIEDDVVNLVFLDEANFSYHSHKYTHSNKPTFWPLNTMGGTSTDFNMSPGSCSSNPCLWLNAAPQPTTKWRYDYARYMEIWNAVTATTSGSVRSYMYPRVQDGNSSTLKEYTGELALNAFAAISSGNQDDILNGGTGVLDGTWIPGTAPRQNSSWYNYSGPQSAPFFSRANLTSLETKNPYTKVYTGTSYNHSDSSCPGYPNNIAWSSDTMTGGVGHLDRFGWGINISLAGFYSQMFYDDMNDFLTATTVGNFVIGCVSAETAMSLQYPYASISGCSSGCTGLSCSDYGCVLGSVDQFTSSQNCSAACQSYNCEINGCVWQYGTGGTFSNATDGTFGLADCQAFCNSYNCVDVLTLSNPTDQGCEMIVGTGGTFVNYSSCTATCQSWNCECDCTISTPLSAMTACTNISNTGGTYSALTSCTATCSTGTSWYCSAQTVDNSGNILTPCYVFCGNGGYYSDGVTPIPMSLVYGPYSTSGAADTVCCSPTSTWDCTGVTLQNSCMGRTLIPGTHLTGGEAMVWLSTFLPSQTITNFSYESTVQTYGTPNECQGPNGGVMYELNGLAHPNINGGALYTNWNTFVLACISASVPLITAGLPFDSVNDLLFVHYSDNITIFEETCFCDDANCGCIEIQGPTGEFSSQTACTAHCCTASTSWNCIDEAYKPICETRPSLGVTSTPTQIVDHYRVNDPTGIFALNKFYPYYNTLGTPVWVTWATAYANTIALGASTYQYCYKKVQPIGGVGGPVFVPTTYLESISHAMISGGTPFYTWQTFYDAVLAAGVTGLNSNTPFMSVCKEIDYQLSPFYHFKCTVITKECCSSEDCYCYEIFTSGGTFIEEIDCINTCCPIQTGYTCDLVSTCIGPIPFASVYTSWFTGPNAQNDCLGYCSGTTTWDCVPASITGTCDDSQYGEYPPNSPAFQASTIAYPFTTCVLTNPFNNLGTVEKVLTSNNFYNPNWAFSAVTWELTANLPFVPNICHGTNNQPLYRLMGLATANVGLGQMYHSWGSFIAAANLAGYGVSTSQNAPMLQTPNGPFDFKVLIEPCICDKAPCHCVEVFGNGGMFQTSGLCFDTCCGVDSWNCTINGCEDPGNGTGVYTVLLDCEHDCKEWLCGASIPPNHIDGKISSGVVGNLIDQLIWLVNNVSQNTPFSDYRYEDTQTVQGVGCVGNSGYQWKYVTFVSVPLINSGQLITTPSLLSWSGLITYLNTTYPWLSVNSSMNFNDVNNTIMSNNNGVGIKAGNSLCTCQTLPCDCHHVDGTGHTNGYHITNYSDCQNDCCSGVCVDTCGVLMVGRSHGVSTYDFDTNTAIHLFHSTIHPGFAINDIAAGYGYIWIYESGIPNCRIEEHKIINLCPFQHVFVREIETFHNLGKGMSPNYDETSLIVEINEVTGTQTSGDGIIAVINIAGGGTGVQILFQLPQYAGGPISSPGSILQLVVGDQYRVTGDILYNSSTGRMLVLYGSGSYVDMWIGEFSFAGNQLQQFHITGGLAPFDYFTALFEDTPTGKKYAISRDGVVCPIKMSPLQIMPAIQQIPDYFPTTAPYSVIVNGATNLMNSSSNCVSLLVPPSWNCKISGGGCVDPKDGTGKYSVFNGAKSDEDALAKCKSACISNTWDCKSTPEKTDAPIETGYELPESITNETAAYDYVAVTKSLHDVPLNQIYFQNLGVTTVSSNLTNTDLKNQNCWPTYSKGWKYSLDDMVITSSKVSVNTWGGLIKNLKSAGVKDVTTSTTRREVYELSSKYFDMTSPFTQTSRARTCFAATCECVEVIGSGGYYPTSGLCVDSCCPTYNCTKLGCVDPGDGKGTFKGIDSLTKCTKECRELLCVTSQVITDTCVGKLTPPFKYAPYDTSFYTVLSWFADPTNANQKTNFVNYKWVKDVPVGTSLPGHCDNSMLTSESSGVGTEAFWFHYTGTFTWMTEVSLGWPFNTTVSVSSGNFYADTWDDVVTYAQNNGCPTLSLTMNFQQAQTEMKDVCGVSFAWSDTYCKCSYTNCGCQEVIGTGYTGAYPYWEQTSCDDKCCPNAIVIDDEEMGMIDELAKIIYEPKEVITTNVNAAVKKLNQLRNEGSTGDDCRYCLNNDGVCLYDGCLSYTNLGELGTSRLNWMFDSSGPSGPSYDCHSTGCYLVWDGSPAQFNGTNALNNCKDTCMSYNCVPGNTTDDCKELIKLDVKGEPSTAVSFIADIRNGYQGENFNKFKYEQLVSEELKDSCPTTDGNVFSSISTIKAVDLEGGKTIINNTSTWHTFISELRRSGYPVTEEMSYNSVIQIGLSSPQKFTIKIDSKYCKCTGQPCHCISVVGTGGTGTYPNLTLCNEAASKVPCCNTDVNSYNCTINGCQQHIGVGVGTYNTSYALWECQQDCTAWGCQDVQLTITSANTIVTPQTVISTTTTTGMSSADTVIHVWYDTSSMGTALLNQAQNAINNWVTNAQQPGGFLDGWLGLITHSTSSAEDWIKWPSYSMDQWSNTTYKNIVVVCLIDESNNVFPSTDNMSYTPGQPGGQGKVPPTNHWYTHKSQFITKHNQWVAAGGTIQTLVYAASQNTNISGANNAFGDFVRHLFAAINGSNVHVTNGTWTLDPITQNPITTNGTSIFGGPAQTQLYGTNEFIDLNWAVTTQNGYRNDTPLSSYGVYGIYNRRGVAAFTQQSLGNDIQQFITSYPITTTNAITTTVYNSATTYASSVYTISGQCVSAQTTLNTSYPFATQTLCDKQDCTYNGWSCGINGCYSQPNGQFLTFKECDKKCYSYTCETKVSGLIQEGTAVMGTYCREFYNGVGTRVPLTGSGYDALSYYLDSVVNGYNFGYSGFGNVNWFINLFDNTGNNTGGVQTTVYPATLFGSSNGITGGTGLIVEDDGLGNCETPSGGRLCRLDKIELIDDTSGLVFYETISNTLEHFIAIMMGNQASTGPIFIPGFPITGIPGTYQGMTLYELIQIGIFNTIRPFKIKIYIKGCPCTHSCDCIKLVGTGQTGTYYSPTNQLIAYNDCVDNCCASLKTWTCPTNAVTASISGCIDPLDGSGAYATKALCDADCIVSWNCLPAANTNNCLNVNEFIPFNLTQSYFTNQDPGFMMGGPSGTLPLASTYGPGGVNSDIEALIYHFDQVNGSGYGTPFNNVGFARGQTYLTAAQQCDYPNGGGRKLGSIEYILQQDLTTYYCYEYEMRVNGVPFMPWSTTASTQSAYDRCNPNPSSSGVTITSSIVNTQYTTPQQILDIVLWMYSQPETNVLGQTLKAGPCNGNSKQFATLFNPGPNTAPCNSSQPAASNGLRTNLKLKDLWKAGLFRPHYGGVHVTTPVNNWVSSWGSGVASNGVNIQFGTNHQPIIFGRDVIINGVPLHNSTECQCATSCGCTPVLGSSGIYATSQTCQLSCCPNDVCSICCRDQSGVQFIVQQLGLNCVCPPNTYQVQCSSIPQIQSCKVGQTWSSELRQCVSDTTLPCITEYCSSGLIWDSLRCECVTCPPQECTSDKTWNLVTCRCESQSLPCVEVECGINYSWDSVDCICRCVTQTCGSGYVWNSVTCQCDAVAGEIIYGCLDLAATNYNPLANTNDGTCTYPKEDEVVETSKSESSPHISALILNTLTHEYVRGCVLVSDSVKTIEVYGTFSTLKECLNSGIGGTWKVSPGRRIESSKSTFGLTATEEYQIIPMCCQGWVDTALSRETPLDYKECNKWCLSQKGHGGSYVPLYNVVGPNTTDEESPLTYYLNNTFVRYVLDGTVVVNSDVDRPRL